MKALFIVTNKEFGKIVELFLLALEYGSVQMRLLKAVMLNMLIRPNEKTLSPVT